MDFVVNVQEIHHDCSNPFRFYTAEKKINSDHVLMIHGIEKVHVVADTINSAFELLRTKMPLDKCRFCVIDEADHESDKNKGNIIKNGALVMYCRLPNRVKVVLYNATFCGEGVCCNKYHQVGLKGQTYVPDYLHQWMPALWILMQLNQDIITPHVHYLSYELIISHQSNILTKHLMLKQAIDAFETNQYLMFYCIWLECDDIHHYLTK